MAERLVSVLRPVNAAVYEDLDVTVLPNYRRLVPDAAVPGFVKDERATASLGRLSRVRTLPHAILACAQSGKQGDGGSYRSLWSVGVRWPQQRGNVFL